MKAFHKITTYGLSMIVGTTFAVGSVALAADPVGERGDGPTVALFGGASGQDDVIAGFGGFVWAPQAGLDQTGFVIRGLGLFVDFDFPFAGTTANGELARGNASLGYQFRGDGYVFGLFGGVDVQDFDFRPAAANANQSNDDVGFIGTARLATAGPVQYPASLEASFSTANDTYWAQGRVGYKIDNIQIGPEITALGSEDYDAVRFGGYASFDFGSGLILQVNGGYNENYSNTGGGRSNDGAYGGGTLVFVF
ncbi:MAG: cellulose biosynthesis protein BcsS [Pseudomonadota bacterium]